MCVCFKRFGCVRSVQAYGNDFGGWAQNCQNCPTDVLTDIHNSLGTDLQTLSNSFNHGRFFKEHVPICPACPSFLLFSFNNGNPFCQHRHFRHTASKRKECGNSSPSEKRSPEFRGVQGRRGRHRHAGEPLNYHIAPKTFLPCEDICARKGWSSEAIAERRKLTSWSLSC